MTEPSNAVLEEKIEAMKKDFYEYRRTTNKELKEIEEKALIAKGVADEVTFSVEYMKDSVDEMKGMMTQFLGVVDAQNTKMDDFVNSNKIVSDKRDFIISILQVASGIIIAVIGYWGYGQL